MKSRIVFGDDKLKAAFEKLRHTKTEDRKLYEWLIRALRDIEENTFCGIQIPKRLIPKEYQRRFGNLDNLWKYNLPNAWRLMYTIKDGNAMVLSIILEWADHKDYERRFNY